jgi:hypothetical protein
LRVLALNIASTHQTENPRDTSEANWRQQFSEEGENGAITYNHCYLLALLLSILDPIPAPKAKPIATQAPLLKAIPRIPPSATPIAIPKFRYFRFFIFFQLVYSKFTFFLLLAGNGLVYEQ